MESNNRSPKRHIASTSSPTTVYEKVRAKLSRSLSSAASIAATVKQPEPTSVVLRKQNVSSSRRCKSELTSPTTAQLLAQFVSTRTSSGMAEGATADAGAACSPGSPETVRPIVSVDKDGIIAVNSKWTCNKCSYAYNPMEASSCEVRRQPISFKSGFFRHRAKKKMDKFSPKTFFNANSRNRWQ